MKTVAACAFLAALTIGAAAHAELPVEILDHDYKACIGDGSDQRRVAYCACMREGMNEWDEQLYLKVIGESLATGTSATPPAELDQLARTCIVRVMR